MAEVQATDAARRKAEEAGIDLASVAGTGAEGSIKVEDVDKAIADRGAADEQTVRVVVNPRLDAAEYVAADGTRYGRDAVTVTTEEYEALSSERINSVQPIVKEG